MEVNKFGSQRVMEAKGEERGTKITGLSLCVERVSYASLSCCLQALMFLFLLLLLLLVVAMILIGFSRLYPFGTLRR